MKRFDRDVGLVLAAFIVFLAIENLVVGLRYRDQFAGTWEMGSARMHLSPIALALFVPIATLAVVIARLARFRWVPTVCAVSAGGALGFAVSTGRRMASLAVRAPFVLAVAIVSGLVAWVLAKWLPRMGKRGAIVGVGLAVAGWLASAFVLPRLYPAFHLAAVTVAIMAWSLVALVPRETRAELPIAVVASLVAVASIAMVPWAAVQVGTQDNLRRVLLEHAPILGRAVQVAARISPPPPIEEDEAATTTLAMMRATPKKGKTLDWRGRDIVLVTVDALRADHVSAYGYTRKTTPNIDALAARGVRFDHAYCPTPHTSYSVASMMTGKYMKPLITLGEEAASVETWPIQLRRYGYRTGGFYPPAVFFIDEHHFRKVRDENLGFEYYKQEFARPALRHEQIDQWLTGLPSDKPAFLWVHLFEPHEPYEMHPEHPFSGHPTVDAYDSEVAAADAFIGDILQLVENKRPPGTVLIVSADHGEEHGDHGGRYHGTTVYEEQVRVPLVIVAPDLAPRVVQAPVQTIDLLPTSLAALDVPIPPRIRGRDLGALLVGGPEDEGLAFAETDDYTLVARGSDRLVCARKIASCTLFDLGRDPEQLRPVIDKPARVAELRKLTAAIERETGKVEASGLPEALRRGMQGDRDAAEDVAPLLDDARLDIRRLAARCAFKLNAPEMSAQLSRTFGRSDEDADVRRWAGLALVRLGNTDARSSVEPLVKTGEGEERFAAALALAEQGDGRGEAELLARWNASFLPPIVRGEVDDARELLFAFAKLRSKAAVPGLVRSLEDVRLRPHVVAALAKIGDPRAKDPLLKMFGSERYMNARPIEARALFDLGARAELLAPLTRFAGMPEPLAEAIVIARDANLLTPDKGGMQWPADAKTFQTRVRLATTTGPARLLVLTDGAGGMLTGTVDGVSIADVAVVNGNVHVVELPAPKRDVDLKFNGPLGIRAAWVVPRTAEIPPPPPQAWTP